MTSRRALFAIIAISSILRLAWAANLGSYTNEAYYFLYARNLDWGYFDHPPMVGAVAAVGLWLTRGLSPAFGLRVGFIGLFAASTWLMARLTERSFGERAGVMAALGLNVTLFFGVVAGTLAGPDGPLLFFWLLTLERLGAALETPGSNSAWVGAGLAWGAAMLSKYYAVLLPAGFVLYLIMKPSARRCLRTRGPYLAVLEGLAVFCPVIGWNATHQWASFAFQGNRVGGFRGFRVENLVEALVGQVLYLTPWIWVGCIVVIVRLFRRRPRDWENIELFLVCQSVPALALFLGVSTFQRVMPHWSLIAFVALLPLLGRLWAEQFAGRPVLTRRKLAVYSAFPIIMASAFIVQARTGFLQDGRGQLLGSIRPTPDPTIDTIRWDQIAREIERLGLLDDPGTFLFTDCWRFSAEVAIALHRKVDVACYTRDARSFSFWSRPRDWVGRDGIFIHVEDSRVEAEAYSPWFSRVEPLATFPIVRAGIPVQTVRLYRCVNQTAPFLFGYKGTGPVPTPACVNADDSGPSGITHRPVEQTVR